MSNKASKGQQRPMLGRQSSEMRACQFQELLKSAPLNDVLWSTPSRRGLRTELPELASATWSTTARSYTADMQHKMGWNPLEHAVMSRGSICQSPSWHQDQGLWLTRRMHELRLVLSDPQRMTLP
mmetsp:Transcript_406/g.1010  ORF Transcript_406/g.1010 Transcript_406/m.1010 type:complete len:125 (+) Transcript_406:2-376(+)